MLKSKRLFLLFILSSFLTPQLVSAARNECAVLFEQKSIPKFFGEVSVWMANELPIALQKIFTNISPSDAKPGAVVAAQTRVDPDYYYHWVRDAALTIQSLVRDYNNSTNPLEKATIKQKIDDYFNFSEGNQLTQTLTGLGEPKFNVDGSAFNGAWGRPQNDGPALRASALIHWFKVLKSEGGIGEELLKRYYDGKIPTDSVIKRDLEYISHHWSDPSFDPWEEVEGDHFYPRMMARKALIEGADLAISLEDPEAAKWYLQQAAAIQADLLTFWDQSKGVFLPMRPGSYVKGIDYKDSGIDSQVMLAFLHGKVDIELEKKYLGEEFLPWDDSRVESTVQANVSAFAGLYPINQNSNIPGVAIGRYPEDRYGGDNFNGGNPWPLATLAVAEIYANISALESQKGNNTAAQSWYQSSQQFIARVQYHANADGSLNEQMDRSTGFMTSVKDLTWNYTAIRTTNAASQLAAAALANQSPDKDQPFMIRWVKRFLKM